MKISSTVLERRFFEPNDDRNGCRLNQPEVLTIKSLITGIQQ